MTETGTTIVSGLSKEKLSGTENDKKIIILIIILNKDLYIKKISRIYNINYHLMNNIFFLIQQDLILDYF